MVFAQQSKSITIDWIDKTNYSFGDYKVNVPVFKTDSYNFDFANKEIVFTSKVEVSDLVDENSLMISNIVYEEILESQLGDLKKENIKNFISASLKNVIARDKNYIVLQFHPIIKDGIGYKKVKSLTYTYTISSVSNKANFYQNQFNISNSVLSSGKWSRFYVEKSGVYRISKSFLSSLGFDMNSVNPNKIKIYGNGGRMLPLSNAIYYPNDLEENAIQIIGDQDGSFDNNDYILFYAEGVDNWSQENETHLNLYSDRSYYM